MASQNFDKITKFKIFLLELAKRRKKLYQASVGERISFGTKPNAPPPVNAIYILLSIVALGDISQHNPTIWKEDIIRKKKIGLYYS